jgi:hypothetical protein
MVWSLWATYGMPVRERAAKVDALIIRCYLQPATQVGECPTYRNQTFPPADRLTASLAGKVFFLITLTSVSSNEKI